MVYYHESCSNIEQNKQFYFQIIILLVFNLKLLLLFYLKIKLVTEANFELNKYQNFIKSKYRINNFLYLQINI